MSEESFTGKLTGANWRQPQTLEKRLAGRIRSRLKGTDPQRVQEFIKQPENRLMLAQWELINRSDVKALGQLMRDADTCKDLSTLLNDLPWVSSFVYDGEMEKPEIALAMVHHFRQADPNMDQDHLTEGRRVLANGKVARPGLKRRVAAAVAVEFTRNGWYGEEKALTQEEQRVLRDTGIPIPKQAGSREKKDIYRLARERYLFFAESISQELLNDDFEALPDWLLHFPCGWKGDSPFGTASTMRWLRDNVAAPAEAYRGMAYQVPYLPTNIFGDSIHGSYYYQPFDVLYPGNFAKETRDVGAVCGGLSHFGTSSACANGVPAITMGEPGHCAYAVYSKGEWHPCNSISEDHHPHWKTWGSNEWSALTMMSAMYEDGARTRDAQLICTLASVLAAHKNPVNALKLYELSVVLQPLNSPVWNFYIATASKSLNRQPRKWLGVNEFVCSAVAPGHPEMCASFLTDNIYPAMLPVLKSDKQKMQAFQDYFNSLTTNEKNEWDIGKLLDLQYGSLGKALPRRLEYLRLVVTTAAKKPEFSPAITWALRTAYKENKRLGERVLALVDEAAKDSSKKALVDAAVIRAGEELGDADLVHRYSQPYLAQPDSARKLPGFERPEGNLVSADGYVQLAKYHPDQSSVIRHASALTEKGGQIRSDAGKHQPVTLVLPKATRIGAIVIIPEGGTKEYRQWKLEISTDGKSWRTVTDLPEAQEKPLVRLVFKRNSPTARYIRIDSGENQAIGINFRALLVYDNKKAK